MIVTDIVLAGVALERPKYGVANATLYALLASTPKRPKLIEMQGRAPVFVRTQADAKVIPFNVMLHRESGELRRDDFNELAAAIDVDNELVPLLWSEGGVDYRLMVTAGTLLGNMWFSRASTQLTAPNPVPAVV